MNIKPERPLPLTQKEMDKGGRDDNIPNNCRDLDAIIVFIYIKTM